MPVPVRPERGVTARGPIRLMRGRVNRSDPFQEHLVGDRILSATARADGGRLHQVW